ncbi:MAG: SRPBCC family protein [Leptolyngbya sp. SIOISBB]|nr:SRPBCC family protein [Leptolyngbya sp. SIOISBB]
MQHRPTSEPKRHQPDAHPIYRTYQALSTAPIEALWQTLTNLADISTWHPLIDSTNAPRGLTAKPGLIYRVIPRWLPIPVRIFVERVSPNELISIRLFPVPGLEERVIYRLESTVWGTQISYSICLRGWLSPVAWSVLRPYASKIAEAIAQAAEETATSALPSKQSGFEVW